LELTTAGHQLLSGVVTYQMVVRGLAGRVGGDKIDVKIDKMQKMEKKEESFSKRISART